NRALHERGADEPELHDLACLGSDGVIALSIARGDGGCALHGDRDPVQRGALLARDSTGNRALLCDGRPWSGGDQEADEQCQQCSFHITVVGGWGGGDGVDEARVRAIWW